MPQPGWWEQTSSLLCEGRERRQRALAVLNVLNHIMVGMRQQERESYAGEGGGGDGKRVLAAMPTVQARGKQHGPLTERRVDVALCLWGAPWQLAGRHTGMRMIERTRRPLRHGIDGPCCPNDPWGQGQTGASSVMRLWPCGLGHERV